MNNIEGKTKFLSRWTPRLIREASSTFRERGLKGVVQRYGWKFFAVFFLFYLVRDVTLYILLPWYLASRLI